MARDLQRRADDFNIVDELPGSGVAGDSQLRKRVCMIEFGRACSSMRSMVRIPVASHKRWLVERCGGAPGGPGLPPYLPSAHLCRAMPAGRYMDRTPGFALPIRKQAPGEYLVGTRRILVRRPWEAFPGERALHVALTD